MSEKSNQPLIGIPCRYDMSRNYPDTRVNALGEAYLTALTAAGAIPLAIPLGLDEPAVRRLYDLADGILLSGGGDVEPSLYGHTPHPSESDVQPERDALEMTLCRWAATEGKPLLAVCRGIQVVAVAANGMLYQDIPSQLPQAADHNYVYLAEEGHKITDLVHTVTFEPDCRLSQIIGATTLKVNSFHHQAVKSVPLPYQITGRASDGVVEAVELPEHPFFCAVQWHPEVLQAQQAEARAIFSAFVAACRRN